MTEVDSEFNSISELVTRSSPVDYAKHPEAFVRDALSVARRSNAPRGETLAALFDLAVTAFYLERVPTSGWTYCGQGPSSQLVYPFVNACPTCTLEGRFVFLKSGKPSSANIGKATSTILAAFLDIRAQEVKGSDYSVRTLSDNGLVDAFLIGPRVIGLFEIKSAPLIAFPLAMDSPPLTALNEDSGELESAAAHSPATVPPAQTASLLIDASLRIPVGDPHLFASKAHYQSILEWLRRGDNIEAFVASWSKTFSGYADPSARSVTHWLTNGCGAPQPRPHDWPRRSSNGYESISDGKSSVGLDRTDDVKKGIYQVLKISTHYKEFFPSEDHEVFAALVSNIHAVKHHDDYLGELEDLIWTLDGQSRSAVISRDENVTMIETGRLHNLFDALISFTRPHFRSPQLQEIYGLAD